jgi:hypothetical protein
MGKSLAETRATERRQNEAGVRRTLVVGPKNPLLLTWMDELLDAGYLRPRDGCGRSGYVVPLADGPMTERADVLKCLVAGEAGKAPVVVLLNYEALDDHFEPIVREGDRYRFRKRVFETLAKAKIARANSTAQTIAELIRDWRPDNVIIDEAHLVSTAGARRSMALRRICRDARFVRLLSGTPDPKRAPSFYAQCVCLDPSIFGTNRAAFVEKYFDVNPYRMGRIEGLKPDMIAEFYRKVYSVMSVVVTEDYFTPQVPNIVTREIPWEPQAGDVYRRLVKDSVLSGWEPGKDEWDENTLVVDGTHKLTKGLRLRQLCAGFLQDELSGDIRWVHHSKERAILADLVEPLASDQFVVISYSFTEAGVHLTTEIGKAFGRDVVVLCNSHTNNATEVLRLFDVRSVVETKVRILVLQEQVGGAGISLARARHLFFHSWSMDSAIHGQMLRRVWDSSRASHITYYQMEKSADGFARAVVQDKLDASVVTKKIELLAALTGQMNDGRTSAMHGVPALQGS